MQLMCLNGAANSARSVTPKGGRTHENEKSVSQWGREFRALCDPQRRTKATSSSPLSQWGREFRALCDTVVAPSVVLNGDESQWGREFRALCDRSKK